MSCITTTNNSRVSNLSAVKKQKEKDAKKNFYILLNYLESFYNLNQVF